MERCGTGWRSGTICALIQRKLRLTSGSKDGSPPSRCGMLIRGCGGELNFYSEYDCGAIRSMFDAAVTLTGLQPLVGALEQRLAAGAAAEPDMPPATSPPPDRDLYGTHQKIQELDRKISATLLKQHGDDADEHPDYLKLEDERFEAIYRLSSTPARSWQDIAAKASTLKMQGVLEDYGRTAALAKSLADDVLGLPGVTGKA